jgi:hypothetical protein
MKPILFFLFICQIFSLQAQEVFPIYSSEIPSPEYLIEFSGAPYIIPTQKEDNKYFKGLHQAKTSAIYTRKIYHNGQEMQEDSVEIKFDEQSQIVEKKTNGWYNFKNKENYTSFFKQVYTHQNQCITKYYIAANKVPTIITYQKFADSLLLITTYNKDTLESNKKSIVWHYYDTKGRVASTKILDNINFPSLTLSYIDNYMYFKDSLVIYHLDIGITGKSVYLFNKSGQVTHINVSGARGNIASTYGYNAEGLLSQATFKYYDKIVNELSYFYDKKNRISKIINKYTSPETTQISTTTSKITYTKQDKLAKQENFTRYDNAKKKVRTMLNIFAYDKIGRLIKKEAILYLHKTNFIYKTIETYYY